MAELPLTNSDRKATVSDEDYGWASQHAWRKDEDDHIVRDAVDGDGKPITIYLCNEVLSRHRGVPLETFGPPVGALSKRPKVRRPLGAYPTPLTEVADDLVRRVTGEKETVFTNDDFQMLLREFGKHVRKGLADDLAPELKAAMLERLPPPK